MSHSCDPWTGVHQAPLPTGFSGQQYWSGLLCTPPGGFPDPGIKPGAPALQMDSLPSSLSKKDINKTTQINFSAKGMEKLIFSSVQFSRLGMSDSSRPHGLQYATLHCPSLTPEAYSNSCPLSRWCLPTMLSSVISVSSCLQSFPASGSFQMSQFFTSGSQSIGVSASASVLSMNIQDWFPWRWPGLISLQPKGLSRVISNTTVQKHQFFGPQFSL